VISELLKCEVCGGMLLRDKVVETIGVSGNELTDMVVWDCSCRNCSAKCKVLWSIG